MLIATALLLPTLLPTLVTPPPEPLLSVQSKKEAKSIALAKQLSWSFVEVHAQLRDVDVLDDELRGFGARGAWELSKGFFLQGGLDLYSDDEDVTRYDIGLGQRVPLANGLDAFAALSWVFYELDGAGSANADEDGWRAVGGLRGTADEALEGELRLGYQDVDQSGLVWGADLRYWFHPQIAVGFGYEREVDDDVWTLGLRYAF